MTNHKHILAFDCSSPYATVALNGVQRSLPHGQQAGLLVPTIDAMLTEQSIGYAELSGMCTTLGPGSFTGLRIALATAHGIALARHLPLYTTTSLAALAEGYFATHNATEVEVAYHAGKGEVFMQCFARSATLPHAQGEITLVPAEGYAPRLPHAISNLPLAGCIPVAGVEALSLVRMASHLQPTPLHEAMPLYIRPPDAKIPALPAWLRETDLSL
jgi:tRNA threonylcarbamoyl adenosine modification protein YeaZ